MVKIKRSLQKDKKKEFQNGRKFAFREVGTVGRLVQMTNRVENDLIYIYFSNC